MQIHIAADGKRTVRLANTEIKVLRRAERLVSELEGLGLTLPEPKTLGSGMGDLLEMPYCQLRTQKTAKAEDASQCDPPLK